MPPNDFRGVKRGDRLTADLLNSLVRSGQVALARQILGITDQSTSVLVEPAFTAQVINDTDELIPAGAPVSLESPVLTTDVGLMNQRAFKVVLLEDATTSTLHVAITKHAIAAGSGGDAYISGACLVQITDDNSYYLTTGGLEILYDSDTSGTRYGVARFGASRPVLIMPIGGNSLGVFNGITTYGITKVVGTLSGVTTQTYSPGTVNTSTGAETVAPSPAVTAWPGGLGYGTRWNGTIYDRVLICNDSRGSMATALIGGASDDTTYVPSYRQVRMLSQRVVSVSKLDGTLVYAYSPDLG